MTVRQVTAYYRREVDGAILARTIEAETDPRLKVTIPAPLGTTPITAEEAEQVLAEHRAEREQMIDRDRVEREGRRQAAYEQLVGLGLAAEHAAFITGARGA